MGHFIVPVFAMFLFSATVFANESSGTLDLDDKRNQTMKEFKDSQIPDPEKISNLAKNVFSKPLKEQKTDELESLAKEANYYANLVTYIMDGYDGFRRDMYKYNFVLEQVAPVRDKYVVLSNKYKGIRNKAYFNIGMKHKAGGNFLKAYLFFRDAYRLGSFDCGKEKPKEHCLRWKAEQEMKALLAINDIESYVSWQKK